MIQISNCEFQRKFNHFKVTGSLMFGEVATLIGCSFLGKPMIQASKGLHSLLLYGSTVPSLSQRPRRWYDGGEVEGDRVFKLILAGLVWNSIHYFSVLWQALTKLDRHKFLALGSNIHILLFVYLALRSLQGSAKGWIVTGTREPIMMLRRYRNAFSFNIPPSSALCSVLAFAGTEAQSSGLAK